MRATFKTNDVEHSRRLKYQSWITITLFFMQSIDVATAASSIATNAPQSHAHNESTFLVAQLLPQQLVKIGHVGPLNGPIAKLDMDNEKETRYAWD